MNSKFFCIVIIEILFVFVNVASFNSVSIHCRIKLALTSSIGFRTGKVILEAVILTAVVVVSLTLYTFWAAKRGYDFNFLGPFLFGAIIVLMVFGFIQV